MMVDRNLLPEITEMTVKWNATRVDVLGNMILYDKTSGY